MSDFLRLLVVFLAAINPPAVAMSLREDAGGSQRSLGQLSPAVGAVVAFALYALAVLGAESFLDWLKIEPESFRTAAGIVMASCGVYVVWFGRWGAHEGGEGLEAGLFPLAIPLLAGPAGLVAAMSYGVDEGAGKALGAVALPLILGAALAAWGPVRAGPALGGIARILGALVVAVAAGLIVSGVRDI